MKQDSVGLPLALRDEAIDWVIRCQANPREIAGFERWRGASPAHEAAAQEASALWGDIGLTPTAALFGAGSLRARRPVFVRRAVLAGGALAGLAGIAVLSGEVPSPASWGADHVTRLGERRHFPLPDGSTAVLNTASALSVRYGPGERRLVLHVGEALFEAAPGDARPFLVTATSGEVRMNSGTFDLRCDGNQTQVLALEGGVIVCPGADIRLPLPPGQRLTYGRGQLIQGPTPVDANAETAWRRGKLIFNRRPLAEVATELERYRRGRIVLADASLRSLAVTGVFDLPDTDSILASVEQTLSLRVTRLPLVTILRR